jgi:hypothetical protein
MNCDAQTVQMFPEQPTHAARIKTIGPDEHNFSPAVAYFSLSRTEYNFSKVLPTAVPIWVGASSARP